MGQSIISTDHGGIIHVERGVNSTYDKAFKFFDKAVLEELNLINCEAWIAGGALREYFLKGYVTTDFDLYFQNEEYFNKAKQWFLDRNYLPLDFIIGNLAREKKLTESDKSYVYQRVVNRNVGEILFENENCIKIRYKNHQIDLVKKFRPNALQTILNFDFTVTQCAISSDEMIFSSSYFVDLVSKKLVIQNFHHPLSTLQRLQKYVKNGFTIDKENLYQLAKHIKTVPIQEINPVEFMLDQLENPNGVYEVKRPIHQKKYKASPDGDFDGLYGTSGNGYTARIEPLNAPEPLEEVALERAQPEVPQDGGWLRSLFQTATIAPKKDTDYSGY